MNSKGIFKACAFALSAMMAMGMGMNAYAAQSVNPDNPTNSESIVIEKNLVATNPNLSSVDGPGVTFSYAIASVTPSADNGGVTITDNEYKEGTVHAGPADGIVLNSSSISYPVGTALDTSPTGENNVKSITATADISKFTAPGIYRYSLSETASGKDTAGVKNTEGTRYLDVYVINGDSGLEFSGVVMHDGSTSEGAPSNKTTFDNAEFVTYNITLKKKVEGNMGDRQNQFPFTGTVSDSGRYFYAKKSAAPSATDADKIAGSAEGSAISTTLAHEEVYYLSGLSEKAAVAYTETNNSADTYQTAITGGTDSAASAVAPNGTKTMPSTGISDASEVMFTNTLESVSPTGVVMRYGAPLLVLLAGLMLLVIIWRNRKANSAQ